MPLGKAIPSGVMMKMPLISTINGVMMKMPLREATPSGVVESDFAPNQSHSGQKTGRWMLHV